MGLIELVILLAIIGFVIYLITIFVPMPVPIRTTIIVIVVLVLILFVLRLFIGDIPVGRIR